ncbi:telomere length regulation protein-domain-containing protein [Thamnocephalis sphaerospora]|uniref:Telomere length regulation protein-domain-containing protein n=1 Tax=Thamnocephalis sphaerospora TaxID=78915 RepID=A0A4P9XI63_9FUNG|nr:telomere length regulation protein-domain-containing protein [Thamnocephalis sphaerospora]|eukprot:RKP05365.1 telomere length regulation protein-domain-containing protein [Thamnocephalis sphaerospora]
MISAADARHWLKQVRAELDAPQASLAAVCVALAEPLAFLGYVPPSQSEAVVAARVVPESTSANRALVVDVAFPEHTRFLLRVVCGNWLPALTREQTQCLFDAYFAPPVSLDALSTQMAADAVLLRGKLHANSLRVLAAALAEQWAAQDTVVQRVLLRLLVRVLEEADIATLYGAGGTLAAWRDLETILCSLPTRVANTLQESAPPAPLDLANYYANLAEKIADAFDAELISPGATALLERCLRQSHGPSMVPTLLQRFHRDADTVRRTRWKDALQTLSTLQQERVLAIVLSKGQNGLEKEWLNLLLFGRDISTVNWDASRGKDVSGKIARAVQHATPTLAVLYVLFEHIVKVLSSVEETAKTLWALLDFYLKQWGDKVFVQHADLKQQQYTTQLLLLLIHHLPLNVVLEAAHDKPLLDGIDQRLKSMVPLVRKTGMVVGEAFSARADPKERRLCFQLDESDSDVALLRSTLQIATTTMVAKSDDNDDDGSISKHQKKYHPAGKDVDQDDDDDDDPDALVKDIDDLSSEEEDEPQSQEELNEEAYTGLRVKQPRYLRDIAHYLRSDEDAEKYIAGLDGAAEILRSASVRDIEPLAVDLARRLAHLQDTFDLPQFHEHLTSALIELMAKSDAAVEYLINELTDRNYSLSRRILLLDCIERTATVLAKQPHAAAAGGKMTADDRGTQVSNSPGKMPIANVRNRESGTVIWRSERLASRSGAGSTMAGGTPWQRRHGSFLYPLLLHAQTTAPNSFSIAREPMVLQKYLSTVSRLVQLSENAPDLWPIASQYMDVLMPLRHYPRVEVTESVLAGLLTVTLSLKPKIHAAFLEYIGPLNDWLPTLLSRPSTTQIRELATALAMSVRGFAEETEAQLQRALDAAGSEP